MRSGSGDGLIGSINQDIVIMFITITSLLENSYVTWEMKRLQLRCRWKVFANNWNEVLCNCVPISICTRAIANEIHKLIVLWFELPTFLSWCISYISYNSNSNALHIPAGMRSGSGDGDGLIGSINQSTVIATLRLSQNHGHLGKEALWTVV